jgi:hypothetical protein
MVIFQFHQLSIGSIVDLVAHLRLGKLIVQVVPLLELAP